MKKIFLILLTMLLTLSACSKKHTFITASPETAITKCQKPILEGFYCEPLNERGDSLLRELEIKLTELSQDSVMAYIDSCKTKILKDYQSDFRINEDTTIYENIDTVYENLIIPTIKIEICEVCHDFDTVYSQIDLSKCKSGDNHNWHCEGMLGTVDNSDSYLYQCSSCSLEKYKVGDITKYRYFDNNWISVKN